MAGMDPLHCSILARRGELNVIDPLAKVSGACGAVEYHGTNASR